MFETIKSNNQIMLKIQTPEGFKTVSKTINSQVKQQTLLERIIEKITSEEEGSEDRKLYIMIRTTGDKKFLTKTLTIKTKPGSEAEKIKRIKKELLDIQGIRDPKNRKYRITIRNLETKKWDEKTIAINTTSDTETAVEHLRTIIDNAIEQKKDNQIVFAGEDPNKKSHMVLFGNRGEGRRCWRISIPNYSSDEVIEIITSEMRRRTIK